ncbi:MAG: ATP-binding protein, partial [Candidatus Hermodarchaeota archaeon]
FLILSLFILIINIFYHIYYKKGGSSRILKFLILGIFILSIFFFIFEIVSFLAIDSKYILENFNENIGKITFFNLSIFFFGISITTYLINFINLNENKIRLESPSYHNSKKGSIKIGKVIRNSSKKHKFLLSLKDLEKHMFICGSTGTGKSNFMQNFLVNFIKQFDIPFFLVEFKGEYHFLQEKIKDLIILWPGENFSINIFNPEGSNPIVHAERIFDILKSGHFLDTPLSDFSPQMEKVLVEILIEVCKNKDTRSWSGFFKICKEFLDENKTSIPMLKQTLISIKNRIRRFSSGPLRKIFESNNELSIKKLFSMNIILDLSSIIRLGGEKEDALFFLNMILKYLWDLNLTSGASKYNGIKHIIIIEDAQYFAPQDFIKKSKLTTYLEDIALLQRGTGECLISLATRPNISSEILANCGVLVSFQSHMQKDLMQELLNLEEEKKKYLSFLDEGQCIIRINSIKDPFLLWVPYIKRQHPTVSEIEEKNKQILTKVKINKENIDVIKKRNINLFFKKARALIRKVFSNNKIIKPKIINSNINEEIENKIYSDKDIDDQEIFREFINNLYDSQKNNK